MNRYNDWNCHIYYIPTYLNHKYLFGIRFTLSIGKDSSLLRPFSACKTRECSLYGANFIRLLLQKTFLDTSSLPILVFVEKAYSIFLLQISGGEQSTDFIEPSARYKLRTNFIRMSRASVKTSSFFKITT